MQRLRIRDLSVICWPSWLQETIAKLVSAMVPYRGLISDALIGMFLKTGAWNREDEITERADDRRV